PFACAESGLGAVRLGLKRETGLLVAAGLGSLPVRSPLGPHPAETASIRAINPACLGTATREHKSAIFKQYGKAQKASGSDLSAADADPLVSGQLLQPHRAAGANFVGADANFRAHAEFAAIGKSGRGVPIDRGGIHFGKELLRMRLVARDNAVRVRRAIMIDVIDGLLQAVHDADIE